MNESQPPSEPTQPDPSRTDPTRRSEPGNRTTQPEFPREESGIRRFGAEKTRSPRRTPQVNMTILIILIGLVVVAIYLLFFKRPNLQSETYDLRQSIEKIEELSTVRSHLRFVVSVREESGNIVVRRLADESGDLAMDDIGSILFHDPTLIAELHAVATYGIRLDDIEQRMREEEDGETIVIDLPEAEILDVKVVNNDTRLIARLEGLFRSSNQELMLEASRRGEDFAEEFARQDASSLRLAETRAREIISLLVEQSGRTVRFEGEEPANGTERPAAGSKP